MQGFVFFGLKTMLFGDPIDLLHGTEKYFRSKTQRFLQLLFEFGLECSRIPGFENHVSTLDEGLDVPEPERVEYFPEIIHLDDLGSTDIYCTQEDYIFRHSRTLATYFANSFSIRRSGISHMIATVTYNARAIKGETKANGIAAV